jgi:CO/xanthine dehydrogenase FAD-binding subunit
LIAIKRLARRQVRNRATIGAPAMSIRALHPSIHLRPLNWAQIEYGMLAALCAAGYVSALAMALWWV